MIYLFYAPLPRSSFNFCKNINITSNKELKYLLKQPALVDQIAVKEIDGKKLRKALILLFSDILIIAREKGKNKLVRRFFSPITVVTVKELTGDRTF
jgi:hypothetical protein